MRCQSPPGLVTTCTEPGRRVSRPLATHARERSTLAVCTLLFYRDVLGEGSYPTPRSLTVRFGEPVRVRSFLEERGLTVKRAVAPLTELLADSIQSMLEELTNEDPGPS